MSIFASTYLIGGAPEDDALAVEMGAPTGVVRTRDGWDGGGVNQYPTDDSGLHAEIGLSVIPSWCVPGHSKELDCVHGDRLRMEIMRGDTHEDAYMPNDPARELILDRTAARALAVRLLLWAEAATVEPTEVQA